MWHIFLFRFAAVVKRSIGFQQLDASTIQGNLVVEELLQGRLIVRYVRRCEHGDTLSIA